MRQIVYVEQINPEPWAMGKLGTGRKGGKVYPTYAKNAVQAAYQEALAETIGDAARAANLPMQPDDAELELTIYVWRAREQYLSPNGTGRTVTRNSADATNIQKATEDALQGILFKNDNQIKRVTCEIVEEGRDVQPCIIIICKPRPGDVSLDTLRDFLAEKAHQTNPNNTIYTEVQE